MTDVFAHGFVRTPITPVDGDLARWHPVELAAVVGREALRRARLAADRVDEVVVGCAEPVGAQGADLARAVVLAAEWPVSIGGLVVDRAETSGLTAAQVGIDAISAGRARTVIVLGVGHASTVPPGAAALNRTYGAPWGEAVEARLADDGGWLPPPRLAEIVATESGLTREALDAWAAGSIGRRRSSLGPEAALLEIGARPGDGSPLVRTGDGTGTDRIRNELDPAPLAELPPAFDPEGMTTAATFSPPADGVTALVLEADLSPLDPSGDITGDITGGPAPALAVLGTGRAAGHPTDSTGAAARAAGRACADAGVALADIGTIEITEPSAAAALLVARALGRSDDGTSATREVHADVFSDVVLSDVLNRCGGTLATGDAGAAEELRLVADAGYRLDPGGLLLTISHGPTGSAAIVWRRRSSGTR